MSKQQSFLALGSGVPHFDLLRAQPVEQWAELQQFLTSQWKDPSQHEYLTRISGCLEKLGAALLQVNRMRQHHDEIMTNTSTLAGQGITSAGFRGVNALADFESLLLQGRSALDRLTWFIAHRFKNNCSSFRKLKSVLVNFEKSQEAQDLIVLIDEAKPWFDGVFGKVDSPTSLRDLVGHRHSLSEGTRTCFGINFIKEAGALVFDCEIQLPSETQSTPILRTSWDSAQYLAYIILNSLSLLVSHATLPLAAYAPTWSNKTVVFADFVIDEPEDSPLTDNALTVVQRMTPDGYILTTRNFRSEIRGHAVQV